jgi:integrase
VITVTLTPREVEIVKQEWKKAPECCEWIFTYVVQQTRADDKTRKLKGERHPITVSGFRKVTDSAFAAAGLANFRRHDLRHTFASRFRRSGGDLKALQNAMDHQDASSTMRYTHVSTPELVELKSRVTRVHPNADHRNSAGALYAELVGKKKRPKKQRVSWRRVGKKRLLHMFPKQMRYQAALRPD